MGPNGPQHAIMGDDANFGLDIPETQTPVADVTAERNMAKFSKTAEFKALKEVIEARIAHHTTFSPGFSGDTPFRDMSNDERGWRSLAADLVISELRGIIQAYETANEVVKDATQTEQRRQSVASRPR